MSRLREMFEEGWYKVLESHLESIAFRKIGFTLKELAAKRVLIAPKFVDTFRAFKECPWDKLHTVLLGQDSYPGIADEKNFVADGLAFSSRYSTKCPKSLNNIFHAVDADIFNGAAEHLGDTHDLSYWANQGILLINCALSLPIKERSGAHIELWRPFITYVLKTINERKDSIAFGLFGKHAQAYRPLLTNQTFGIYTCEHPAAVEHRGTGKWNHEEIFKRIDAFHKFKNNIHINW